MFSPYAHECVDRPHLDCPACKWVEEQEARAPSVREDVPSGEWESELEMERRLR